MARFERWTRHLRPWAVVAAALVVYLPFIGLGYGTDIDVDNLRRSGKTILDGPYEVSRTPGSLVYEAFVGVADRIGGAWLVNLGSVVMAGVLLVCLGRIVAREFGSRRASLVVALVAVHPWFWMAATSMGDFVWTLAFVFAGIDSIQRGRRIVGGVLFGLAIGSRMSSILLVGSYALARVYRPDGEREERFRERVGALVVPMVVALVVGMACFVPAYRQFGSFAFFQNQFEVGSVAVLLGRWVVKNTGFFGWAVVVTSVVFARTLVSGAAQWKSSEMVRTVLLMAVCAEAVYLRLPFKPMHLLPMAVVVAVLVAASPRLTRRSAALFVAATAIGGLVSLVMFAPDQPNSATTGEFSPQVVWGVTVNDVRCRVDPVVTGPEPALGSAEAADVATAMFECQSRAWKAN